MISHQWEEKSIGLIFDSGLDLSLVYTGVFAVVLCKSVMTHWRHKDKNIHGVDCDQTQVW